MEIQTPYAAYLPGMGSAYPGVDYFLKIKAAAGLSDSYKVPLKNLYDGILADGYLNKIQGLNGYVWLMLGDTSAQQQYLLDFNTEIIRTATFLGTPVFSSAGFNPNGAGRAYIPFTAPVTAAGQFKNYATGVFNSTSEVVPTDAFGKYLLRWGANSAQGTAGDFLIYISRILSAANPRTFCIANSATLGVTLDAGVGYDNTKTGMLSEVRAGANMYLVDNGTTIKNTSGANSTPTGGGLQNPVVGGDTNGNSSSTKATLAAAFYGDQMTLAENNMLTTRINIFLTAIGRI